MIDESNTSSASEPSRRAWRDDPLSLFLAVAAVLLAIMYAVEQAQLTALEERAAQAQAVGSKLAADDCVPGSAGRSGTTLVLRCKRAPEVVAAELDGSDWIPFHSVVIAGPLSALRCGVGQSWPTGCVELARGARAKANSGDLTDVPK